MHKFASYIIHTADGDVHIFHHLYVTATTLSYHFMFAMPQIKPVISADANFGLVRKKSSG